MKKMICKMLFWVAVLFGAVSCNEYELDIETTKSFCGNVVVTNADSTLFTDADIRVTFSESVSEAGMYDIFLKQVKFAEKMPVRIDMTIPSVGKSAENIISGDSIVPWALGGPYERYTIYNLTGHITYNAAGEPTELQFDMMCGDYPVTYRGIYTEEVE